MCQVRFLDEPLPFTTRTHTLDNVMVEARPQGKKHPKIITKVLRTRLDVRTGGSPGSLERSLDRLHDLSSESDISAWS